MTLMVEGYCHRCRKPLGQVGWDAADFVFCKRCRKAVEVYTPPPRGVQNVWHTTASDRGLIVVDRRPERFARG
jgi:hypothetical protein